MNHYYCNLVLPLTAAVLFLLATSVASAEPRYGPPRNQVFAKECGACHMAFPPQMLPQRSWVKIMAGLSDHFGEDASLDAGATKKIQSYLTKNAADANWWGGKFMRGVTTAMTPLRITETPYWIRQHSGEIPARVWKDPRVKSKANCAACHRRAERGNYDDD